MKLRLGRKGDERGPWHSRNTCTFARNPTMGKRPTNANEVRAEARRRLNIYPTGRVRKDQLEEFEDLVAELADEFGVDMEEVRC